MGLIRLIIFGAIIAIAYFFIKRWLNPPDKPRQKITHNGDMVRCAHCGTFVPEQDAIRADGKSYCSQAHLLADRES